MTTSQTELSADTQIAIRAVLELGFDASHDEHFFAGLGPEQAALACEACDQERLRLAQLPE